jgi:hypothetical protein
MADLDLFGDRGRGRQPEGAARDPSAGRGSAPGESALRRGGAARGPDAPAHARRVQGAGAPPRRGEGDSRHARRGSAEQHDPLGTSGQREDDAGPPRRRGGRHGVRSAQRRDRGNRTRARDHRRGGAAASCNRTSHDPLLRRDSPLQQGAAGRVPAACRAGHGDPDRGHDRESVVRGRAAPAFPGSGLPARASFARARPLDPARGTRRRAARARWRAPDDRRGRARVHRAGLRRRRAPSARRARGCGRARAGERPRTRAPARPGTRCGSPSRSPRRLCSTGSPRTTRAARSTTTSSRRSTSRCADSIPTRALLADADARGGEDPLYVARRLVRLASEDIGLADPAALT